MGCTRTRSSPRSAAVRQEGGDELCRDAGQPVIGEDVQVAEIAPTARRPSRPRHALDREQVDHADGVTLSVGDPEGAVALFSGQPRGERRREAWVLDRCVQLGGPGVPELRQGRDVIPRGNSCDCLHAASLAWITGLQRPPV